MRKERAKTPFRNNELVSTALMSRTCNAFKIEIAMFVRNFVLELFCRKTQLQQSAINAWMNLNSMRCSSWCLVCLFDRVRSTGAVCKRKSILCIEWEKKAAECVVLFYIRFSINLRMMIDWKSVKVFRALIVRIKFKSDVCHVSTGKQLFFHFFFWSEIHHFHETGCV